MTTEHEVHPLARKIDEVSDAITEFKTRVSDDVDAAKDRIAQLEQQASMGGQLKRGNGSERKYREIPSREGTAFELKKGQRFGDVPAFASGKGVGVDRLLGAAILPDCVDTEAVSQLAELKSVQSGTSGITLDAASAAEWTDRVRSQAVIFI